MALLPPMRSRKVVPRLADYDYSRAGMYFVTIVTVQRECIFGRINGETMDCNAYGAIVAEDWLALPNHFPTIEVYDFVVMPNHFHGIITFSDLQQAGVQQTGQANQTPPKSNAMATLSTVIGGFKSGVTRQINLLRETPGAIIWQRSFHDRIIRSEAEFARIQEYIAVNPLKWASDRENPDK